MVMWLRFACTVSRKPLGLPAGTLRLRNVRAEPTSPRSANAAIAAAAVAAGPKSYLPRVRSGDTAMLGIPSSDPSRAPETVPEYVTSSPRLYPLLMPETIRSGADEGV